MEKKNYLILDDEFYKYCELNKIDDVDKLIKQIFKKGFDIIKYGETPITGVKEKIIEKEVIREVEVIKEIPVEKIVEKKIIDTKIDNKNIRVIVDENNRLITENEILKNENVSLANELNNLKDSLQHLNKGKIMKNSDLSSLYGE